MVELILGSMKSGKSKTLLDRLDRATYTRRGRVRPRACLVRPKTDTREFVSRKSEGIKYDLLVLDGKLVVDPDNSKRLREYDVICIDEAQFFPDLAFALFYLSHMCGKTIYAACLQGDRNMKSWAAVSDSIPVADRITQIQAVCEFCGDESKSTFTYYDGPHSDDQVIIGDGEYHAACASCWVERTRVKEGIVERSEYPFGSTNRLF